MMIFQIKNLDCSKKKNRIVLVKNTAKVLKLDHKPTKEELQKYCKKICKKYNMPIKRFEYQNGAMIVNIEVEPRTYSSFVCLSYYEMMCKYILFVRAVLKNRKLKVK